MSKETNGSRSGGAVTLNTVTLVLAQLTGIKATKVKEHSLNLFNDDV